LISLAPTLTPIPAKRYFTIGEVSELCGVKSHVLRYWEQEFTQLRPMKRRGNRRYYQHHEVLVIRRIRDLLYEQGFTISGARNRLQELAQAEQGKRHKAEDLPQAGECLSADLDELAGMGGNQSEAPASQEYLQLLRRELHEIRDLLTLSF
jgi:DNA-binding transcriptional MerR regulator